jgi:hypothetical protein
MRLPDCLPIPSRPWLDRAADELNRRLPLSHHQHDIVIRQRSGEKQAVDAVEHAAVDGDDVAEVLDSEVALEDRFAQVAELPEYASPIAIAETRRDSAPGPSPTPCRARQQ